ncbi:hypothetical protein DER46DRAFT_688121 [Fusarium sp. MPI-SDFR-AT-0072]|nr:hypothetical protein DER46DRAFT_688121 [Fusarium sp. MPI-SDFR-AT-0072]
MESSQSRLSPYLKSPHRAVSSNTSSDQIELLSPYESFRNSKPQTPDLTGGTAKTSSKFRSSTTDGSFTQRWSTYTLKPWNMCLLTATNQSPMMRYGTIISFCAKASLGTAVAMAFQQRARLIARHKMARLETVDATLAVVAGVTEELVSCPSVRTLNFDNKANFDWRERPVMDDFNSTHFDYWNAASTMYTSVVLNKAVFMREPLVRDESAEELASGVGSKVKKLGDAEAPFNTSILAPEGNYNYMSMVARENYTTYSWPRPKDLGVFKNEPIIWIGYSTVKNINEQQPKNKEKGWDKAYTPVIFGCEHHEVNYTVRFDYKREYVRKVANKTLVSENTPGKTSKKNSVPESNWINPLPITDLRQGIQKLYEDLVMSLFSELSFVAVAWASNGKPSGTGKGDASTRYPCRRQRQTTLFVYKQVQLLFVYAASILLAVIGVLVGIQAYRKAGVMLDMKPSSIIGASKNGTLSAQRGDARTGYGLVQDGAETSPRTPGMEGNVTQQERL